MSTTFYSYPSVDFTRSIMPDNELGPRVTGRSYQFEKPATKPGRRAVIAPELLRDFEMIRLAMIDTPAEVDEYDGESWMTPDQIAVLKELRAECG